MTCTSRNVLHSYGIYSNPGGGGILVYKSRSEDKVDMLLFFAAITAPKKECGCIKLDHNTFVPVPLQSIGLSTLYALSGCV